MNKNKISAIVVDDEINSIKLLVHFIQNYCPEINVIAEASTKKEAIELINEKQPQILFLDIRLDSGLSFELLDKLNYKEVKVIFVTAYDEYAVKAFRYNAIDYILKPVDIDELITAVIKAVKDINTKVFTSEKQLSELHNLIIGNRNTQDFIAVSIENRIDFINIDDIQYLKSEGRYTFFYLVDGKKIMANKNLGEFEKTLNSKNFYRTHRSYIINLNKISNIYKSEGGYCVMKNGDKVPIARRKLDNLLNFINSF